MAPALADSTDGTLQITVADLLPPRAALPGSGDRHLDAARLPDQRGMASQRASPLSARLPIIRACRGCCRARRGSRRGRMATVIAQETATTRARAIRMLLARPLIRPALRALTSPPLWRTRRGCSAGSMTNAAGSSWWMRGTDSRGCARSPPGSTGPAGHPHRAVPPGAPFTPRRYSLLAVAAAALSDTDPAADQPPRPSRPGPGHHRRRAGHSPTSLRAETSGSRCRRRDAT